MDSTRTQSVNNTDAQAMEEMAELRGNVASELLDLAIVIDSVNERMVAHQDAGPVAQAILHLVSCRLEALAADLDANIAGEAVQQ